MQTATRGLSLVRPETPVLAYLAKWTLRVVFLLGVSLALAVQAVAAPVEFEANGQFEYGTLAGAIAIDTATGKLLSSDLIIMVGSDEIVFANLTQVVIQNKATRIDGTATSAPHKYIGSTIQLVLPVSTLVGFKGCQIDISTVDARDYGKSYWIYNDGQFENEGYLLYSGSLEPN